MALLYEVRPSPGKGRGVFATRDIKPGTVVMRDERTMIINNGTEDAVGDSDLVQAFYTMNDARKAQYLSLHEGVRKYSSKIKRIYVDNNFRQGPISYMLLGVSLLNHSCTPNTERVDDEEDKGFELLVAVKPIAKGEEMLHSYYGNPFGMTTKVRLKFLSVFYGFKCDCAACNFTGQTRSLSDARRVLVEALTFALSGRGPGDFSMIDQLTPENADAIQAAIGKPGPPFATPRTPEQLTAYYILIAWLCEAEGCVGLIQMNAYGNASLLLASQILEMKGIVVIDAARTLRAWMDEAKRLAMEVCLRDSKAAKGILEREKNNTYHEDLGWAMIAIKRNDANSARGHGKGMMFPPDVAALVIQPRKSQEPRFHMLDVKQVEDVQREGLTREEIQEAVFGNYALKED